MKNQKEKKCRGGYFAPDLQVITVTVERGFAASGEQPIDNSLFDDPTQESDTWE